jgi:hypothetical protein
MQDRPSMDELLEAVAGFLRDDVMANTTGRVNFHARVAANVVEMLRREAALEEPALRREWDGLSALVGGDDEATASLAELRAAVLERNVDLAGRIRDGWADDGERRAAVIAHLRTMMRDKLAVSNPGLLASE